MNHLKIILKYLLNILITSIFTTILLIGLVILLKPSINFFLSDYFINSGLLPTSPTIINSVNSTDLDSIEKIAGYAINATKDAIDIFKWAIAAIIGIFGAIIGYFIKTLKDTDDKLKETNDTLIETNENVQNVKHDYEVAYGQFEQTQEKLESLSINYFDLQKKIFDFTNYIPPYQIALEALQSGKIDRQSLIETQQWLAWHKMIYFKGVKRDNGFKELLVFKNKGITSSRIKEAMIIELIKIDEYTKNRYIRDDYVILKPMLLELLGFQESSKQEGN